MPLMDHQPSNSPPSWREDEALPDFCDIAWPEFRHGCVSGGDAFPIVDDQSNHFFLQAEVLTRKTRQLWCRMLLVLIFCERRYRKPRNWPV